MHKPCQHCGQLDILGQVEVNNSQGRYMSLCMTCLRDRERRAPAWWVFANKHYIHDHAGPFNSVDEANASRRRLLRWCPDVDCHRRVARGDPVKPLHDELKAMFNRWVDDLNYVPPEGRNERIRQLLWRAWATGANNPPVNRAQQWAARWKRLARALAAKLYKLQDEVYDAGEEARFND